MVDTTLNLQAVRTQNSNFCLMNARFFLMNARFFLMNAPMNAHERAITGL